MLEFFIMKLDGVTTYTYIYINGLKVVLKGNVIKFRKIIIHTYIYFFIYNNVLTFLVMKNNLFFIIVYNYFRPLNIL